MSASLALDFACDFDICFFSSHFLTFLFLTFLPSTLVPCTALSGLVVAHEVESKPTTSLPVAVAVPPHAEPTAVQPTASTHMVQSQTTTSRVIRLGKAGSQLPGVVWACVVRHAAFCLLVISQALCVFSTHFYRHHVGMHTCCLVIMHTHVQACCYRHT